MPVPLGQSLAAGVASLPRPLGQVVILRPGLDVRAGGPVSGRLLGYSGRGRGGVGVADTRPNSIAIPSATRREERRAGWSRGEWKVEGNGGGSAAERGPSVLPALLGALLL